MAELTKWDLSHKDLREFDLSGGRFSGIEILGSNQRGTNFKGADLSRTRIAECDLTGTRFTRSVLSDAKFSSNLFDRTNFDYAKLKRVEIVGSDLWHSSFVMTDLSNAKIINDQLRNVYFYRSKLLETVFQITERIEHSVFRFCNLRGATFLGENSEICNCDFRNSDLQGGRLAVGRVVKSIFGKVNLNYLDLSDVIIEDSDFGWTTCIGLNLDGSAFYNNNFSFVDLSQLKLKKGAYFDGNDFSYAKLGGYDFTDRGFGANKLIYTDLSNCNLAGEDLSTSEIIEPNFQGANLKGTIFKEEQLNYVQLTRMQQRDIMIIESKV